MSSFIPSDYKALDLSVNNYLDWAINTSAVLKSRGLGKCIKYGNDTLACERHRAIMIMRHHLCEDLRDEFGYVNDPHNLWSFLNSRFCEPLLHESKKKWEALRFQDYEPVDNYHSDLMRSTYSLKLCGELVINEDLLNKTRDTFHSEEVLLSHQAKVLDSEMKIPEANKATFDKKRSEEDSEWTLMDHEVGLYIE
ncbi:uncharacterized protein LOC125606582 [Brassica napus]|uniref:uncharacterized protein LOC125606582 n=1 Tax=Brassica napus TaxID=3708 RepID=UPI0020791312|nr:uncharacterized protein LOC125606582 [Brassica napus]